MKFSVQTHYTAASSKVPKKKKLKTYVNKDSPDVQNLEYKLFVCLLITAWTQQLDILKEIR